MPSLPGLPRKGTFAAVAWALATVPVLAAPGIVETVTLMYPLDAPRGFLFGVAHPIAVYLLAPLVMLSAFVLVLAPGMMAVAAAKARSGSDVDPIPFDRWLLYGFAASIPIIAIPTGLIQAGSEWVPRGRGFVLLVLGFALVPVLRAVLRGHGHALASVCRVRAADVASVALPLAIFAIVFSPKLYWESFNGDGAHAFEVVRLLLNRPVPFFGAEAAGVRGFPGVTSMLFAFPGSWFVRLFGEYEAAARLPYFLYLGLLASALSALVSLGRGAGEPGSSWRTRLWSWPGLAAYTVVVAYSATYSANAADLALPATQDTLLMVAFLGFVLAFERGEWVWLAGFVGLTLMSLPSGAILVGFWCAVAVLVRRPIPLRRVVLTLSVVVIVAVALWGLPPVLRRLGLPAPGGEYRGERILDRLSRVRPTEWQRGLFPLIGGGIAPVLVVAAWRRLDELSRRALLVSVGYFAFFYIQARVALHHFVPAMILPMVALWRWKGVRMRTGRWGVLALAVLAVWIARPASWQVQTRAKAVGAATEDRRPGYATSDPAYFRGLDAYWLLFARPSDPRVPDETYGDSQLAWSYYAQRRLSLGAPETWRPAYLLVPATAVDTPAAPSLGEHRGVRVWVLDTLVWRSHRAPVGPSRIAPLLRVDRSVLFDQTDEGVVELRSVLGQLIP